MAAHRADDPELELAVGDAVDDRVRVGDRERDGQVRVAALELAQEERHEVRPRACRGAERQRPGQNAVVRGGNVLEQLLLAWSIRWAFR